MRISVVNPSGIFLVARNGSSNLLGISAIRWIVKKSIKIAIFVMLNQKVRPTHSSIIIRSSCLPFATHQLG